MFHMRYKYASNTKFVANLLLIPIRLLQRALKSAWWDLWFYISSQSSATAGTQINFVKAMFYNLYGIFNILFDFIKKNVS